MYHDGFEPITGKPMAYFAGSSGKSKLLTVCNQMAVLYKLLAFDPMLYVLGGLVIHA
jgi:hypothetical protein